MKSIMFATGLLFAGSVFAADRSKEHRGRRPTGQDPCTCSRHATGRAGISGRPMPIPAMTCASRWGTRSSPMAPPATSVSCKPGAAIARARRRTDRYLDTFASAAARRGVASGGSNRRMALLRCSQHRRDADLSLAARAAPRTSLDRCRISDLTAHYGRLENGRIPVRRTSSARAMGRWRPKSTARKRLRTGRSPPIRKRTGVQLATGPACNPTPRSAGRRRWRPAIIPPLRRQPAGSP